MKKLLLINYPHMLIGGIENYIYFLIKQQIKCGVDIIWLCDVNPQIAKEYEDVLLDSKIRKVSINTHGLHWGKHEKINMDGYDKIAILSFSLFDHIRAYEIKKDKKNVSLLYYVPHFKGGRIFSDEYAPRILKSFFHKIVGKLYQQFDNDKSIRYFSPKHRQQLKEIYNIDLDMSKEKIIPTIRDKVQFDEERCRRVYLQKEKIILSVTRFEFPHKGYLLGLITDFEEMCKKYDNLVLQIIGYGVDEDQVVAAIETLPDSVQNKIFRLGKKAPTELEECYKAAYVNVGVAGCAEIGGKNSVVTLPARHYCNACEVYGFMSKNVKSSLSDKPGEMILPYIDKLMNMSEEEYIKTCYESYLAIYQGEPDSEYIFRESTIGKISTTSRILMIILSLYNKIRFKLRGSNHAG